MLSERAKKLTNCIANSVIHGLGFCFAVTALVLLIVFASIYGTTMHVVSVSIYGTTLVIMYLFSTLYHSIQNVSVQKVLRVIDHSAVYLLIAGTYTPFTLITLNGTKGWTIFGIIWGLAILGIVLKSIWINRFPVLFTLFYVVMGWLIVFSIKDLFVNLATSGFVLLVLGGIAYTVGVVFFALKERLLMHAVWHLFVLTGSILHFFAILFYVIPYKS
jgi:hemolysin III